MAVTSNLTLIHACEALTDGTTSHVLTSSIGASIKTAAADEVDPRQGTGCFAGDLDVETGTYTITLNASIDFTASTIYGWFKFITANYLDTWENGGISCTLSDGTNTSEWYLGGSDSVGSAWERLCFSTSSTPDVVSGTLTLTAVTVITFSFIGLFKSKLPENLLMDYLHYGADGVGMTVTAGTSGTPETWLDVEGDDFTAAIGLLFVSNNIYAMNGPITFGSTAAVDTYFADSDQVIATSNRYRTFTTTNRTTAESLVSDSHYTIEIVGGTGVTSFVLGSAAGDLGYSGCVFKTGGASRLVLSCVDTDVDIFQLYGCSFINCGTISLPVVSGTSREVVSCNFSGCDQIDPSTCLMTACIIANSNASATGALLLDASGSANLSLLTFISGGTGHGIYIPSGATGTYTLATFTYSGYALQAGTDTNRVIYNNSAGAVTIQVNNGDSPSYRDGTSATTTIVNTKTLTVNVVDTNAIAIPYAKVRIENASTKVLVVDGIANNLGVFTYSSYNYTGDESVNIIVRKNSPGELRYLPASQPATISSTGLTTTTSLTLDLTAGKVPSIGILQHGVTSEDESGDAVITSDIDLPAGTNRKLVIGGFYWDSASDLTVSAVTYDGNAMTVEASASVSEQEGAGNYHEIFFYRYDIPDSDTGRKIISVTYSSNIAIKGIAFAVIDEAATGAADSAANNVGDQVTSNPSVTLNNTAAAWSVVFLMVDDIDSPSATGVAKIRRSNLVVDELKMMAVLVADRTTTGSHSLGADYGANSKTWVAGGVSVLKN